MRAPLLLSLVVLLPAACAGPSKADLDARMDEANRIQHAGAVHMPPAGVDSCVGATVRLTSDDAEAERKALESRIKTEEIDAAMKKAGIQECVSAFKDAAQSAGMTPEPLRIKDGYAVDPAGRVCAVVERQRMDPIDPGAAPLLDDAATCLKDVLFRARFPEGRVVDKERMVRFYSLDLTTVETVRTSSAAKAGH